jgi:hypothetical protein
LNDLPFELFVAVGYLLARRKQAFISLISLISAVGVAVGVMALLIVLAPDRLMKFFAAALGRLVVILAVGTETQCCDSAIERLATRRFCASFRGVVRWNRAIHGGAVESRSGSPRRWRSSTARHAVSLQVERHLVVQRESCDVLGWCLWMQRGR